MVGAPVCLSLAGPEVQVMRPHHRLLTLTQAWEMCINVLEIWLL